MNEKNNAVNQAGRHTSAPSPAAGFEVLLITGMSGAGRSHAANSIEDMGWYVVDNMPPKLLVPLVDMMTSSGSNIHKLAAVIDVRSRDYFDDLSAVLSHLDDLGGRPASCSSTPATRCSSSATNPCAGPIRCSRAIV